MEIHLDWYKGFYNLNSQRESDIKKDFTSTLLKPYPNHCQPLVNTKWCQLWYKVLDPLELDYDLNQNEWNVLHPLFDANWYYEKYQIWDTEISNPYIHFLTIGFKENFSIHPLIDTDLLLKNFPECSYLDKIIIIGDIVMRDDVKYGKVTFPGELPILSKKIDWNYLFPALAWRWT